ncbi:MAG: sec-independent protein translocase protein TatB [Pseudomonadota bacterium]|nr:sec-independent protein translocase protein TatB [Pseudomonadota bacterium]
MFDVGFWEVALILVLALIVLGPERLPQAARTIGHWVGRVRRYVEGVRSEVEKEFDASELKRILHNQEVQIRELQGKLNQSQDILNRDVMHDSKPDDAAKKIESPAERQYEIIEEKDFHAEQQASSKPVVTAPVTDATQAASPVAEKDKPV